MRMRNGKSASGKIMFSLSALIFCLVVFCAAHYLYVDRCASVDKKAGENEFYLGPIDFIAEDNEN